MGVIIYFRSQITEPKVQRCHRGPDASGDPRSHDVKKDSCIIYWIADRAILLLKSFQYLFCAYFVLGIILLARNDIPIG